MAARAPHLEPARHAGSGTTDTSVKQNTPEQQTTICQESCESHGVRRVFDTGRAGRSARGVLALARAAGRWLRRDGLWYLPLALLAGWYAAVHVWVCDDAYISFRYARHLAAGQGLVFNLGERVEGYSNFLWVLELAALYRLGVPPEIACVVLALGLSVGVFVLTAKLALTTPLRAYARPAAFGAVFLLAINRNVAVWATSGLETRQLTFLVLLAIWLTRTRRDRRPHLVWASVVLGLAELTRPEGLLLGACVGLWFVFDARLRKQWSWRDLARLCVPFACIVAAHYLWRYAYYGQWLPNTYYAKVLRPWPDAGLNYFAAAACDSGLYLVLPLCALGGVLRWSRARDSLPLLGAMVIVPHAIYLITVGGDHFEFRPLDLYWPLLAVGTIDGLALLALFFRLIWRRGRWPMPRVFTRVFAAAGVLVVGLYSTVLQIGHETLTYSKTEPGTHLVYPITADSFPTAFFLPFMEKVTSVYNPALHFCTEHAIALSWIEHKLFARERQRDYGPYGRSDRERFPPDAVMAHCWMGTIPYSLFEITFIDAFGLTDAVVARHGRPSNEKRLMAHARTPPPGYYAQRGVNISVERAARTLSEALSRAPYAVNLAPALWAPFKSDNAAWVNRAFQDYEWYRVDLSRPADSVLDGHPVVRVAWLGGFEGDEGWALSGSFAVVDGNPGRTGPTRVHQGARWLSSYAANGGDQGRGVATSPEFAVPPRAHLCLLVAGGGSSDVGAELIRGGEVLEAWHGDDTDTFRFVLTDLDPYAGQHLRVRAFDRSDEAWGHVMIDAVLLFETS